MNRKILLSLLGLLLCLLVSPLMAVEGTDTKEYTLNVGAMSRTFLVHVPKNLSSSRPPLVIALHGAAINGKLLERFTGLSDTAEKNGFIVVYPNGSGLWNKMATWNAGSCCGYAASQKTDDVAFIEKLMGYMVERFGVDPSRIYVTGLSNGAMMAYRLAAELPDRIAAIACIAGAITFDPAMVRTPVPVLAFHGTDDLLVPYGGRQSTMMPASTRHTSVEETIGVWVKANKASPVPVVTELPYSAEDPTRVVRYVYGAPGDPDSVVLYKIIGGGHTWPGQPYFRILLGRTTMQISANDIMWTFFSAHPGGH